MYRLLTLLLCLGVLAGLVSGGFVHLEHHQKTINDCGIAAVHGDCEAESDHPGCHQHACHHAISPGVAVIAPVFVSTPRLLGNVPARSAPSIDEPVYEPATPPLIGQA